MSGAWRWRGSRSTRPGPPSRLRIDEAVRARTTFRREDLLARASRAPFAVVVCRNVLIYLGPEGQARALGHLVEAVRFGGLLMLGQAEVAVADGDLPLELIDRRERIYRRTG
jgi:two-component system, chemotaxis family, CheB/CheR fusion protein